MSEANATGELKTMSEKDFDRMYGWFNLQTAIYTQAGSEHPEIVAYVDSPEHVRLFTAAPDLLAVALAVLAAYDGGEDVTNAVLRRLARLAKPAVDKATGGN